MLSAYNAFVDLVKSSKTDFVKATGATDEVKRSIQTYIDAQAHYAKAIAQEAVNFWTTVGMAAYSFDAKKAWPSAK